MAVLRILVAEDQGEDVESLKRAFSRAGVGTPLNFVWNGKEAIDYLKGEGAFANRLQYPLPTLLLLDLHVPVVDGFGVLEWLRQHPDLRRPLVVVFSSSERPEDIRRAYDLGANSFLTKPSDINEWMGAIEQIVRFWLHDSSLPEPGPFIPPPKSSSNLPAASPSTRTNRPASKSRRSNQSAATQKRKHRPSS